MALSNEDGFLDYIMRKLGAPTVKVNLDVESIQDAVTDAIERFCERHKDGSEEHYYVVKVSEDDALNGYITVPVEAQIQELEELLPTNGYNVGQWHNPSWQMAKLTIGSGAGGSSYGQLRLADFVSLRQRLGTINDVLGERFPYTFKRYKRRIICHFNINVGDCYAFKASERCDPRVEGNEDAWNDPWLKAYATALTKERWGNVLVKAQGIKLPGDIELDGTGMLSEAKQEIETLNDQLQKEYEEPIGFLLR